jgi:hypothetical protein
MGQKVGNNEGIPPSFPIFAFTVPRYGTHDGDGTYSRAPTGSTGTQFKKDANEYCIRSVFRCRI